MSDPNGGCTNDDEDCDCKYCVAEPELNAVYWGEHNMESSVCELMRIAAGGCEPGESPGDVLSGFGDGLCDTGLSDVVAEAVEASLARDRAKSKRAKRKQQATR
jgi:hypothetical protein